MTQTSDQPPAAYSSPSSVEQQIQHLYTAFADKIFAAAQPGGVFSPPVVSGSVTIITASEVMATGGVGLGGGQAQGADGGWGSGSGGFSMGRPVAAIIIRSDGQVKVQPVVDATKVALAGIAAWGSLLLMVVRWLRANRR